MTVPPSDPRLASGPMDTFVQRFQAQFSGEDWSGDPVPVLVALSGGLDSVVLLHLLRFGKGLPPVRLQAAHFDHPFRALSQLLENRSIHGVDSLAQPSEFGTGVGGSGFEIRLFGLGHLTPVATPAGAHGDDREASWRGGWRSGDPRVAKIPLTP